MFADRSVIPGIEEELALLRYAVEAYPSKRQNVARVFADSEFWIEPANRPSTRAPWLLAASLVVGAPFLAHEALAATYTVRSGDTLMKIARNKLGSSGRWGEIYALNRGQLAATNKIYPGQQIELPERVQRVQTPAVTADMPSAQTYTVKKGDSLVAIAKRVLGSASRWKELFELNRNRIRVARLIYPGQVFRLPGSVAAGRPQAPTAAVSHHQPVAAKAKPAPDSSVRKRDGLKPSEARPGHPGAESPTSEVERPSTGAESPPSVVERPAIPETVRPDPGQVTAAPQQPPATPKAPEVIALPPPAYQAKDPFLAAGLSLVVPGAGNVYVGEVNRGLAYFGVGAVAGGGAIYGAINNDATALTVGGLGLLATGVVSALDAYVMATPPETPAVAGR